MDTFFPAGCYIIDGGFEFEMRDLKTRDRVAYTLTQFPMMIGWKEQMCINLTVLRSFDESEIKSEMKDKWGGVCSRIYYSFNIRMEFCLDRNPNF